MESLITKRGHVRAGVTKAISNFKEALENKNRTQIVSSYHILEDKAARLFDMDNEVSERIYSAEKLDDDKLENEYQSVENYREQIIECRTLYDFYNSQQEASSVNEDNSNKKRCKLPEIQLVKFSGNVKEWLPFWGQFKRIDEDPEMEEIDKFQYLIQSMTEHSRAYELVSTFPLTGRNYKLAINELKTRFAKDEYLIDAYMRDIIGLILSNEKGRPLADLVNKLESSLKALEVLGVASNNYTYLLFPLVESSVPSDVLRAWERSVSSSQGARNLDNLMEFLRSEVISEERIAIAKVGFRSTTKAMKDDKEEIFTAASLVVTDAKKTLCIFCERDSHLSQNCNAALKLSIDERLDKIKKKNCCLACLRPGHRVKVCRVFTKCIICYRKHLALVCPTLRKSDESDIKQARTTSALSSCVRSQSLMQTVFAKIHNGGKYKIVRLLFDSGSQKSYILKKTAGEMRFKPVGSEIVYHMLFGGQKTQSIKHNIYKVYISNLDGTYSYCMHLMDQDKICNDIPRLTDDIIAKELEEKNIFINDQGQGTPEVQILIGADHFGHLLTGNIVNSSQSIVAIETHLGWTVSGISRECKDSNCLSMYCCSISEIWKLESIGIHDASESKSSRQVYDDVMNHFQENIRLNAENRYEIKLPWMYGHPELISNKSSAVQRLGTMSKKLISKEIFAEYDSVLKQWLADGIIEVVHNDEDKNEYFLPHRPVIKESSLTTKIRPVFDGFNEIGVIADIRKAFLQISIHPADRNFLKFVWWKDTVDSEVITYRHCRLVFGLKPSPFLLGATINHHLETVKGSFDENLIETLRSSFYVDNLVSSVSSQSELESFFVGSNAIMEKGKFELGSWAHTIIKNSDSEFKLADELNEIQSVLGMFWDIRSDLLYCDVKDIALPESTIRTKRVILSISQKIFDPVGITSPATLLPKILLQKAWSLKVGWDEELPTELRKEFDSWLEKLHFLKYCKIPRYIFQSSPISFTIHAFSDASKKAYAGCVFIRTVTSDGVKVQLLQAKARVAPLKPISIPRLELLAAVITGRLVQNILKNAKFSGTQIFYWTDSKVVLGWLACNKDWNTFVSNRVREILEHSGVEQWNYVPGELNIADLPSRGCNALNLLKSKWWEGPSWLIKEENLWPKESVNLSNQEIETLNLERRKTCSVLHGTTEPLNVFAYFSSCYKIIRMVGWMLRFCRNCKSKKGEKSTGPLSLEEISNAELVILKLVQEESFEGDKNRELKNFEIFRDENCLLRLKTKLFYGEYENLFKCPILLPSKHIFVKRLIEQAHINLRHAGVATLVTFLRERYWIIRARKTVREVLNSCIKCKRFTAKRAETSFIPLPKERVNMVQAFAVTGVDTAGPLFLKDNEKVWVIIFTCAVYRCVHFELISSLSTECFLLSLRRFVARRGRIAVIFSDNGTNFIGAYNLFKRINWEEVREYAYVNKIEWHFNPPTAAWWGGFWERMIRTLKDLLKRNLGRSLVNYEDLLSIMLDCEAVINSRPITYFNDDPEELITITPAMFLHPIGECEVADLDAIDSNVLNKRFKHINNVRQNLRSRFRKEYLSQLASRPDKDVRSINIGDIVLIGSEEKKRVNWPIGRVLEVFAGKDGSCRVAKVRTSHGNLIRPFQRLYSLEISDEDSVSIAENYKKSKEINNSDGQVVEEVRTSRYGREIKSPQRYDV